MIYLLGSGQIGFGDQMIVKAWLDVLQQAGSGERIIVDGNDSARPALHLGGDYANVSFIQLFTRLAWSEQGDFWAQLNRGLNFLNHGGYDAYPRLRNALERLDDVKVFHLHGGGYINALWPANAFLLGVAVALKRHIGCRLFATGQGLWPVPQATADDVQLFRSALSQFDYFECRDRPSFDALAGMIEPGRLVAGADDTFLQPVRLAQRVVRRRWFHVSSFIHQMDGFLIDVMRVNLQAIRANFGSIVFWECLPEEDADLFRNLQAVCGDVHRVSLNALIHDGLPLQSQDFVLTSLFHPHLAASRAGCSGVALQGVGYFDISHESARAIGSSFGRMVRGETEDLRLRVRERSAPDRLARADAEIMRRKEMVARLLYGAAAGQRAQARA